MVAISAPLSRSTSGNAAASKEDALRTGPARHELAAFICALSGACKKDGNVIRDSMLVDVLELQAKQILRARRQRGHQGQLQLDVSGSGASPSQTQQAQSQAQPQPQSQSQSQSQTRLSSSVSATSSMASSVVSVSPPLPDKSVTLTPLKLSKRRKLSGDAGSSNRPDTPVRYQIPRFFAPDGSREGKEPQPQDPDVDNARHDENNNQHGPSDGSDEDMGDSHTRVEEGSLVLDKKSLADSQGASPSSTLVRTISLSKIERRDTSDHGAATRAVSEQKQGSPPRAKPLNGRAGRERATSLSRRGVFPHNSLVVDMDSETQEPVVRRPAIVNKTLRQQQEQHRLSATSLSDHTDSFSKAIEKAPSSNKRAAETDAAAELAASMVSTESSSSAPNCDSSELEDAPTPSSQRSIGTHDQIDVVSVTREKSSPVIQAAQETRSDALNINDLGHDDYQMALPMSSDVVTPRTVLGAGLGALSLLEKDEDMTALVRIDENGEDEDSQNSHSTTMQDSFRRTFVSANEEDPSSGVTSQLIALQKQNSKVAIENARLTEVNQMSLCDTEEVSNQKARLGELLKYQTDRLRGMERQLVETERRAYAQENCRRAAEKAFQAELESKVNTVRKLENAVKAKDEEIASLSKRVEDVSGLFGEKVREEESRRSLHSLNGGRRSSLGTRRSSISNKMSTAIVCLPDGNDERMSTTSSDEDLITNLRESNLFKDMEMKRMKSQLLEKDREICHLYIHLSTKKKLIEDITKKFVNHMEGANAQNQTAGGVPPVDNNAPNARFEMDKFLFKNVVEKQRRMDELTAALGVMDREVVALESRVEEKQQENNQLKENQDVLTRSLRTVNAQVCRIQTENERLVISLRDKQSRITALIAELEEKERRVLDLDEQVDLRQTQLDVLLADNKPTGRRSLRESLFKGRGSLVSNKSNRRSSLMSFTSARGPDDSQDTFMSPPSPAPVTAKDDGDTDMETKSESDAASQRRSSVISSVAPTSEGRNRFQVTSVDWTTYSSEARSRMSSRDSQDRPSRSTMDDWRSTDRKVSVDYESDVSDSEFHNRSRNTSADSFNDVKSTDASYCASDVTEGDEILRRLGFIDN